MVPVSMILSDL